MDTLERVKKIVAEELGIDWQTIKPNDDLEWDLGADSLHIAEIVMSVEKEFDIKLMDEETTDLRTSQQIADHIVLKLNERALEREFVAR